MGSINDDNSSSNNNNDEPVVHEPNLEDVWSDDSDNEVTEVDQPNLFNDLKSDGTLRYSLNHYATLGKTEMLQGLSRQGLVTRVHMYPRLVTWINKEGRDNST